MDTYLYIYITIIYDQVYVYIVIDESLNNLARHENIFLRIRLDIQQIHIINFTYIIYMCAILNPGAP